MTDGKFGWRRDDIYAEYDHRLRPVDKRSMTQRWPRLRPEDLAGAGADRGILIVCIVERYGISSESAARQVAYWDSQSLPEGSWAIERHRG